MMQDTADYERQGDALLGLGVKVTFVSINPSTDQMVQVINSHCAEAAKKSMTVVDLSSCAVDAQSIAEKFGQAVQEEITRDWISHHC
jgi:hypothetical protein